MLLRCSVPLRWHPPPTFTHARKAQRARAWQSDDLSHPLSSTFLSSSPACHPLPCNPCCRLASLFPSQRRPSLPCFPSFIAHHPPTTALPSLTHTHTPPLARASSCSLPSLCPLPPNRYPLLPRTPPRRTLSLHHHRSTHTELVGTLRVQPPRRLRAEPHQTICTFKSDRERARNVCMCVCVESKTQGIRRLSGETFGIAGNCRYTLKK